MIHVSTVKIKQSIPGPWFAVAQTAKSTCATCADRKKHIEDNEGVWTQIKTNLAGVLGGKCWYCETKNSRADNAVDHFRPKNAVAECKTHGGYWWKAFDWENYRFSCQFCNSRRIDREHGTDGGKHHHFPLLDESRRAIREEDESNEQPLLLDPCYEGDSEFLWFNEDGSPSCNDVLCGDPSTYPSKRVEASIRLYHLDHHNLIQSRIAIYVEVYKKLAHADSMLVKIRNGDTTARESYAVAINELRSMGDATKELSSTVKCAVRSKRGKSPSAEVVF